MAELESQLIISADDRTAAAFAQVQGKLADLQAKIAQVDASAGAIDGKIAQVREPSAAGLAVGARVEELEGTTRQLESQTPLLAAAGASMLETMFEFASVASGVEVALEGLNEGLRVTHERLMTAASGLSPEETKKAEEIVEKEFSKIPQVSAPEMMQTFRDLKGPAGSHEVAAKELESAAKFRRGLQFAKPDASSEEISKEWRSALSAAEAAGVAQDPEKLRDFLDGLMKGIMASGGRLTAEMYEKEYLGSKQAGGVLSPGYIMAATPVLAPELGGAFGPDSALFEKFMGQHVARGFGLEGYQKLADLGILPEEAQKKDKTGEVTGIERGGHFAGEEVAKTDPDIWVHDTLIPKLVAHGFVTPEQQRAEVAAILPPGAAQLVQHLIDRDAEIAELRKGQPTAAGIDSEVFAQDEALKRRGLRNLAIGALGAGAQAGMPIITKAEDIATAILSPYEPSDLSHRFRPPAPGEVPPPFVQGPRSGANRFGPLAAPTEIGPENAGSLVPPAPPPGAPPSAPIRSPFEHVQSLAPRELGPENVGSLAPPPAAAAAPLSSAARSTGAPIPVEIVRGLEMIQRRGGEEVVDVVGHRREQDLAEFAREATRGRAFGALPVLGSSPGTGAEVSPLPVGPGGASGGSMTHSVSVSGAASVEQTLRVEISIDPRLSAALDAVQNLDFSVPLNGAASTGTMDTDAAPQRAQFGTVGGQ